MRHKRAFRRGTFTIICSLGSSKGLYQYSEQANAGAGKKDVICVTIPYASHVQAGARAANKSRGIREGSEISQPLFV
jgi:hypothetical protein